MLRVTQKSRSNVCKETVNIVSINYPQCEGVKNKPIDSLQCSSPQKSLVKDERFIRVFEEKPELAANAKV